jgi:hypothetical protein
MSKIHNRKSTSDPKLTSSCAMGLYIKTYTYLENASVQSEDRSSSWRAARHSRSPHVASQRKILSASPVEPRCATPRRRPHGSPPRRSLPRPQRGSPSLFPQRRPAIFRHCAPTEPRRAAPRRRPYGSLPRRSLPRPRRGVTSLFPQRRSTVAPSQSSTVDADVGGAVAWRRAVGEEQHRPSPAMHDFEIFVATFGICFCIVRTNFLLQLLYGGQTRLFLNLHRDAKIIISSYWN